jgi:hypothetical protein
MCTALPPTPPAPHADLMPEHLRSKTPIASPFPASIPRRRGRPPKSHGVDQPAGRSEIYFGASGETSLGIDTWAQIAFRVLGGDDKPLANASVFLYGAGFPARAVTDASGQANLSFYDNQNRAEGEPATAKAVYVKPAADHWHRFVPEPILTEECGSVASSQRGLPRVEAPLNWWTPLLSSGGSGKVSNGSGTASIHR